MCHRLLDLSQRAQDQERPHAAGQKSAREPDDNQNEQHDESAKRDEQERRVELEVE